MDTATLLAYRRAPPGRRPRAGCTRPSACCAQLGAGPAGSFLSSPCRVTMSATKEVAVSVPVQLDRFTVADLEQVPDDGMR